MKYKVIPFNAELDQKNATSAHVADRLSAVIAKMSSEGWSYVRLESVTSMVTPENGCFGFGSKPAYTKYTQLLVFERNE